MQKIEAQYEIVTPMFIGGADKQDTPEIRPPSIKGALRFWWRALQWGECLQQANNNAKSALAELHRQEAELFGAAFKDDKYGQGKIRIKVKGFPEKYFKTFNPSSGQSYLLGQGLYHFNRGLLQAALESQQTFTVVLLLDNDTDIQPIINTLLLFGMLGGLGSRSRKGWGSVAIRSLTHIDKNKQSNEIVVAKNSDEYKQVLNKILLKLPDALSPFSAFSTHTRIDVSLSSQPKQAQDLLTKIGEELQIYRSYGRNNGNGHKVNGKDAEQNFTFDHDLILEFAKGENVSQHPKRVVFGLPHNYFYSNGTKVDVDAEAEYGRSSRRASPLIIHIHKFTSGKCIAVQSLLKADFLPANKRIQLKKGRDTRMVNCDVDWTVITDYLDRFKQGERIL